MKTFFKYSLKSNFLKYLALYVLLIILSPYIYLSFFAQPIADDYCYALTGKTNAFFRSFVDLYFSTGGRYTTNAIELFNPLVFDRPELYKFVPAIQILFVLLSVFYFLRAITSRSLGAAETLIASLLFLLLFLGIMPSLAEGIYFYSSAVAYTSQLGFSVLYFGMLSDYFNRHFILNRFFHLFVASLLLIISMGFTEVLSFLLVGFHFCAVYIQRKVKGGYAGKEQGMLLFLCLACLAVMLLAPGNAARSAYFEDNHDFFHSVFYTLLQTARFSSDWISFLPVVLLALVFAGLVADGTIRLAMPAQWGFFKPWISIIVLAGILFICIFPPYFATNILGQHRTVNTACFFFLVYFFLGVAFCPILYTGTPLFSFFARRKFRVAAIALSAVLFSTTGNGYLTFTDLFYGKPEKFAVQMKNRTAELKEKAGTENIIYFKPLEEKPGSLFVLDLQPDSSHWINYCQAKYFGAGSIVCKE